MIMDNNSTRKLPETTGKQPSPPQQFVGTRRYTNLLTTPASVGQKKRKPGPTRIALTIFLAFIVVGGGLLSVGYYLYYKNIREPLNQFIRPVSRGAEEVPGITNSSANIQGRAWNILLLGSDNDNKYRFPAVLTQVMLIVRVDTVNNSITLLSIPRDSWVWVPDVGGMHKIDQAFFLGANRSGKFEDGVRLARLTVEKDYGIPIDRYGWVGLEGFAKVIDTLGGLDIDVTHPMIDDLYPDDTGKNADPKNHYAYKRIYIAPGPQHLNGQQALEYVRTRHGDLTGDIGRTERQQQVLQALKLKLNTTNIISHLSELFRDLAGHVYTDLNEQEMIAFANFARTLDTTKIQRLTLGPGQGEKNYGHLSSVYDPSVGSYQDVIIPNCATIQPSINRIFQLGEVQSCNVTGA
jgi:LCP family protein required for cell wall assembly